MVDLSSPVVWATRYYIFILHFCIYKKNKNKKKINKKEVIIILKKITLLANGYWFLAISSFSQESNLQNY